MERADLPRLVRLLARLCEVYGKRMSDELAEAWLAGLSDVPFEQVDACALVWIRTERRMPTPADCREAVERPLRTRAEEAWTEVRPHLLAACAGDWPDATTVQVLRLLGGYARIGDQLQENVDQWTRRDFIERYEELARRALERRFLKVGADDLRRIGVGDDRPNPSSRSPEPKS